MTDSRIDDGFDEPSKIDDVRMAFGGDAMKLMPTYEDIPDSFRNRNSRSKWAKFQSGWFFQGLDRDKITPRDDVDFNDALRHLKLIQTSFEPKHEHKAAAVAWLASRWFADVAE